MSEYDLFERKAADIAEFRKALFALDQRTIEAMFFTMCADLKETRDMLNRIPKEVLAKYGIAVINHDSPQNPTPGVP